MNSNSSARWEAVIGLEIHTQINTASKQFSACDYRFTRELTEANKFVDPVVLGLPGVLPVLNRESVIKAILFGVAVECTPVDNNVIGNHKLNAGECAGYIDCSSVFARKHYYYPDLPKGYQITQYDRPIIRGGALKYWHELPDHTFIPRKCSLVRAHLEEDTGKLFHRDDGTSIVDYNRAGVPLLEIVTQPEFIGTDPSDVARQCVDFLEMLRLTLVHLNISDAEMEKGNFRCEPNISVRPIGATEFGVATELKNLNSFRVLRLGVEAEVRRQIKLIEAGESIYRETIRWDEANGCTVPMRRKESSDDYRYFDEPDLPPLILEDELIGQAQSRLRKLPYLLIAELMDAGATGRRALDLVSDESVLDYYNDTVLAGADTKSAVNWIMTETVRLGGVGNSKANPSQLAELIVLQKSGKINQTQAKQVWEQCYITGKSAPVVITELNITAVGSEGELKVICQTIIAANPDVVERIKKNPKAIMALVGIVMKETKGAANAKLATEIIMSELGLSELG